MTKQTRKVICPYCGEDAHLTNGRDVYPHRPDLYEKSFWICYDCDAYVGCHSNSKDHAPLGRLANAELRRAKSEAHRAFDPIWRDYNLFTRSGAYAWLAEQLGIKPKHCHIGMFDVKTCRKVVELAQTHPDVSGLTAKFRAKY